MKPSGSYQDKDNIYEIQTCDKKKNLPRSVTGCDLTLNVTSVFLSPHSTFRDRKTQNSETNHIPSHAM